MGQRTHAKHERPPRFFLGADRPARARRATTAQTTGKSCRMPKCETNRSHDERPCHWRPTFTYDPNEDGTLTPRWTDRWHLVDADGSEVRDNGALIMRTMSAPDRPLPDIAWEGERVRRPRWAYFSGRCASLVPL